MNSLRIRSAGARWLSLPLVECGDRLPPSQLRNLELSLPSIEGCAALAEKLAGRIGVSKSMMGDHDLPSLSLNVNNLLEVANANRTSRRDQETVSCARTRP